MSVSKLVRLFREYGAQLPVAALDYISRESKLQRSIPYWQSLRGKHAGRRGFVIGNGPSLRLEDLERLATNEISIASNKIYLAFPEITWRPDYFTICDRLVWLKTRRELHNHFETVHLAGNLYGVPSSLRQRAHFWRNLTSPPDGPTGFSDSMAEGAFGGSSITYQNIQFAVHLGLNPIYLIGCDHYYRNEENTTAGVPTSTKNDDNHFIAGYRAPGEKVNPAPIDRMDAAYAAARDWADRHKVSIFNATRGGHLEKFNRVDFDTLFD